MRVIGCADGPTAVLVAADTEALLLAAAALIALATALVLLRRNRK